MLSTQKVDMEVPKEINLDNKTNFTQTMCINQGYVTVCSLGSVVWKCCLWALTWHLLISHWFAHHVYQNAYGFP